MYYTNHIIIVHVHLGSSDSTLVACTGFHALVFIHSRVYVYTLVQCWQTCM